MKKFYTLLTFPFRSVMPLSLFGLDDLAVAAIIGTIVSAGISIYNSSKQDEANKTNIANQNKVNAQNLDFQEKQFAEQSYLNRNQYQLTASDMQKVGLNPLTMNGANLTSGNFNSTAQAASVNPYQIDGSALSNIATTYMQAKTQKQINKDTLQTQRDIAKDKNDTDWEIAKLQSDTQIEMTQRHIDEQARESQAKLANDLSIENIKAALIREGYKSDEAIAKAQRVQEQLKRDQDYQLALEKIRQEDERIKNAHSEAEKKAAIESRNGWLNFASKIFQTVIIGATNIIGRGGASPSGSDRPIGFSVD